MQDIGISISIIQYKIFAFVDIIDSRNNRHDQQVS